MSLKIAYLAYDEEKKKVNSALMRCTMLNIKFFSMHE